MKLNKSFLFLIIILISIDLLAQNNEIKIKLNDTTTLELTRTKFIKNNKKIKYWSDSKEIVSMIDDHLVFGTDACLPKYELSKAILKIGTKNYVLDTKGMYDPWLNKKMTHANFKITKYLENPCKLRGVLSIGSGIYYVEWQIIGSKSFRTILCSDWQIINDDNFLK